MTPEELRDKLIGDATFPLFDTQVREVVLNTIRAAYAIEREMCARICEEQGKDVVGEWYGNEEYRRGANACVAAIRSRKES